MAESKSEVTSFSLSPLPFPLSFDKNTRAARELSLKATGAGKEPQEELGDVGYGGWG